MTDTALEKLDEEMDKVTDHGVGLVAVAKAVKSLNLTLAHHAAWAEERFEAIDQRFELVDQRFEAIDRRFDVVDERFAILEQKVDAGFGLMLGEISKLSARVEEVFSFAVRSELKVHEISE